MNLVWKALQHVGVNPERLALKWASSAEAPRFVQLVTQFTEKIRGLGPLGLIEGKDWEELKYKLRAARQATRDVKLRMAFGKLAKEIRKEGTYRSELIEGEMEKKLGDIIKGEINRSEIVLYIQEKGPVSSENLSAKIGIPLPEIEDELAGLGKKGLVEKKDEGWVICETTPTQKPKRKKL